MFHVKQIDVFWVIKTTGSSLLLNQLWTLQGTDVTDKPICKWEY